ncbi:MAG: serine/threonine-protein kinase [Mariprofundaceae bacterium]
MGSRCSHCRTPVAATQIFCLACGHILGSENNHQYMGAYRLQTCIGRGSTSLVYNAFDEQIKRQVAIKVLPRHVLVEDQMQRFRQEAEIHARLIHPNIVKLYNTHEDRGFFALIMELLQGCTLEELLQTKAPLATGEIMHLSRGILSALAKAHSKGIVHQDLKASNIFLCNDGKVKIKDFGLAAFTESGSAGLSRSHASTNGNIQLRYAYMLSNCTWLTSPCL